MIDTVSDGGITTIVLDRPRRRNAITAEGLTSLREAVETAADPVVYLTGRGRAFCAGADLDSVAALDSSTAALEFARLGQSVAKEMEQSESVVIAGIDGPARGGGVELALAADIRVATESATFAETGVDIGLFGAWGGTVRLPEVVGLGPALDIALTGRTLSAREALAVGLVTQVVDDPLAIAADLAEKPSRSLRTIKRRMRDRSPPDQRFDHEASAFAELVQAGPCIDR